MRLAKPFFKLPVVFDVERLRAELAALPESSWSKHPNDIAGNSSLRLISVDGAENDDVDGPMLPTPNLLASPYLLQVLSSFGVVWSRSRFLRLSARHGVPPHADINYHWFYRARLHIPIVTQRPVRFHCDDESVHMSAGEAWIFDNWRLHRVENPVDAARIHLVADTTGSAAFWDLVSQGESPNAIVHQHRFDPSRESRLLTERTRLRPIMPPGEIDLLILDLRSELTAVSGDIEHTRRFFEFHRMLDAFRRDWRQLYSLFGDSEEGRLEFIKLRDSLRAVAPALGAGLFMKTNRVAAHTVLEGRVLRVAVASPTKERDITNRAPAISPHPQGVLDQPIFIVAAPRSGSTLLFETLAASSRICTLGGEAHWLIESIAALQFDITGVGSNRLTASHYSSEVRDRIFSMILQKVVDNHGNPVPADQQLRLLEKTPKNALRIPFFNRMFPNARFIYLWREPRGNISSIIEAWRSGNWKTYNGLKGFDGPWSLLLPPGWREMNRRPIEEIAAFQWECTNRTILDDLVQIDADRWTTVSYDSILQKPKEAIKTICGFVGIDFDHALAQRVSAPLPHSRFTHTAPAPGKWQKNELEIERVMPGVQSTWNRLQKVVVTQ